MAASKGKRYSAEERKKILDFIKDYDKKNKRGGLKTASEKFGVSAVSINRWSKTGGKAKKPGRKPGRKPGKKPGRKPGRKPASSAPSALHRMVEIQETIGKLQKEYDSLKASL